MGRPGGEGGGEGGHGVALRARSDRASVPTSTTLRRTAALAFSTSLARKQHFGTSHSITVATASQHASVAVTPPPLSSPSRSVRTGTMAFSTSRAPCRQYAKPSRGARASSLSPHRDVSPDVQMAAIVMPWALRHRWTNACSSLAERMTPSDCCASAATVEEWRAKGSRAFGAPAAFFVLRFALVAAAAFFGLADCASFVLVA